MISEDVIRVHVENAGDLRVIKTQEHEPEHFAFATRVIANAVGYDKYCQLLAEDPQRKDWSVVALDQPIVLCHSAAQANSAANQINTIVNPPDGAIVSSGGAFTFTGTGPVWIAATSSTPTRVSVAVNRRGSALWGSRVVAAGESGYRSLTRLSRRRFLKPRQLHRRHGLRRLAVPRPGQPGVTFPGPTLIRP